MKGQVNFWNSHVVDNLVNEHKEAEEVGTRVLEFLSVALKNIFLNLIG